MLNAHNFFEGSLNSTSHMEVETNLSYFARKLVADTYSERIPTHSLTSQHYNNTKTTNHLVVRGGMYRLFYNYKTGG